MCDECVCLIFVTDLFYLEIDFEMEHATTNRIGGKLIGAVSMFVWWCLLFEFVFVSSP